MLPAAATLAVPVFVTPMSADRAVTVVVDVAALFVLFASPVAELTVAVFVMMVPPATAPEVFTTSVKTAFTAAARDGFVAVIVPVAPEAGVVNVQPAGAVI